MPIRNIERNREYQRSWYANNRRRAQVSIYASRKRRKQELKDFIAEYLSLRACVDCGEKDIRVLDFDHVRDKKRDNISHLVRASVPSMKTLQIEISKCEIRCCNCHRKVTHERRLVAR